MGVGFGALVAEAVEIRVVTWNVQNGVGVEGSVDFRAVRETLERLDPDVIALQEVDVEEASPSAARHFADLRALLTGLGFATTRTYLATAGDGFQAQAYVAGDFGHGGQSVVVASRFPITRTVQIGRGVAGRREQTRFPLYVRLAVPGVTGGVALVNVHFKQGDARADEFRRGVEGWRVREFLMAESVDGRTGHVLVVGDVNEEINEPQSESFLTAGVAGGYFFGDGSGIPTGYTGGADWPTVLPYAVFPASAFESLGVTVVPARQTDGVSDRTYHWAGDARLDYILAGAFTQAAGAVRAEVYHSGRESVGDGLPKRTALPDPVLSLVASDHLPVVADCQLVPTPALEMSVPGAVVAAGFSPDGPAVVGTVSLPAVRDRAVTVTLGPWREAPLLSIPPVVIPAGEVSARFVLVVRGSPFGSDRRLTLVATADGYRSGLASVSIRGGGANGRVLISQYTETPSGSSPKAVEIINVSAREIFFAAEPLRLLSFSSGAVAGVQEVLAEAGRLPVGAVVVIGDAATGRALVADGLLRATDAALAGALTGTVFTDTGAPDGRAVFIKRGLSFNGDDALEVRINGARSDVFGLIGHDPGTAWTGSGVSTANQNLSRRRTIFSPSAGWVDPSQTFEVAGVSLATAMSGMGVAPVLDDPYVVWAAERGLVGAAAAFDADPDDNGVANGLEFVFAQPLEILALKRHVDGEAGPPSIGLQVRHRLGNVRWGVAVADDLSRWHTVAEQGAVLIPGTEDFGGVAVPWPSSSGPAGQARLFVIKP